MALGLIRCPFAVWPGTEPLIRQCGEILDAVCVCVCVCAPHVHHLLQQVLHFPLPALSCTAQLLFFGLSKLCERCPLVLLMFLSQLLA